MVGAPMNPAVTLRPHVRRPTPAQPMLQHLPPCCLSHPRRRKAMELDEAVRGAVPDTDHIRQAGFARVRVGAADRHDPILRPLCGTKRGD